MSVVLRCPTCGTSQLHVGECEACSEGEVRYFCTNHEQGLWLDEPVCSRCGAEFGAAPRKPRSTAPTRMAPPAGAPDFRAPGRRRGPDIESDPGSERRSSPRLDREEPAAPEVLPPVTSLEDLLGEFADARARMRTRPVDPSGELPWTRPPSASRAPRLLAGCLLRAVGLVFFLILAAIILLFMLFGGFVLNW